ncbi:MAG: FAD-binding oxidoreductase [candidate division Zixibacteria bacterium]|nr:FAD-binding oxidoreductase [candidate division Zixibacteria bacterium]MBU1469661.1 FAD-binding oxidoreductase [candidate division Zixibacteria bacterium]
MSRIRSILSEHFPNDEIAAHGSAIRFTPDNEQHIVKLVELAIAHQFKICPAGSMSHIEAGDFDDSIVIASSEHLNSLIDYSPDDLYITVGAVMRLRDVNSHVTDNLLSFVFGNLDYDGTVGGAVAVGLSAQFDGETVPIKRSVPSLAFVTPYGKLIRVGAVTLKSVAGYDVPKLLVGSRGQFGFITSITLRLSQNAPANCITMAGFGESCPTIIRPHWGALDASLSHVERNLKSNLDPHGVFPGA